MAGAQEIFAEWKMNKNWFLPVWKNIQCDVNSVFPNIQANPLAGQIDPKSLMIQHCLKTASLPRHTGPGIDLEVSVCFNRRYGKAHSAWFKSGMGTLELWTSEESEKESECLGKNGEELRDGGLGPVEIFGSQDQGTIKAACLLDKMRVMVPSQNTWNTLSRASLANKCPDEFSNINILEPLLSHRMGP